MSPRSKKEYLEAVYLRYRKASRKQKTAILDEFCSNCGYHRKHVIRLLRNFKRFTKPKPRKKGRKPVYRKEDVLKPLKRIWLAANQPCSKRLKAVISLWLPGYIKSEATRYLLSMSPATIDRLLKPTRVQYNKRGRATTKPGTLLRKQIPIKTNQWDESLPGFLEADTVAHCGNSLSGMFVYTIDFVDIATGWTEQRAVWGKGEAGVLEQIKNVEESLPFPLLGFDSDNGSEFLNYHLLRHFTQRKQPVQFTRSRPYHKDDNAHIEQKNWTHVRQWLGYHRLDHPNVVPALNVIGKQRLASKTIKRYDEPKTPCQRVIESTYIPEAMKNKLQQQMLTLNPFKLRNAMEKKLKKIFDICCQPKP
jgi:hypothetical protein